MCLIKSVQKVLNLTVTLDIISKTNREKKYTSLKPLTKLINH